jgi:hypothetical protein
MPASIFKSTHRPVSAILILAIMQVLCATWLLDIEGFSGIISILFLLSGIGISFFLLKIPSININKQAFINKQLPVKLLVIILLLPVSYQLSRQILDATPIQKEYADMMPVMKTMCTRFIDGHWRQVYDPIPEIWNGIQPIYLPAMWLPFTSSIILHFDMRWITVCGIWLSVLICVLPGIWKRNLSPLLFTIALLVLLYWLHFDKTNNVIRLTEDGVVFFYYSLMVIAIISGNPWLTGIAAALCLLSRYAIIGWIPFAGLYLLYAKRYNYFGKAFLSGLLVLLLLVIIPFGIKPFIIQLHLPGQYIAHAQRIWRETPEIFQQSLGMAKFFGTKNIQLLHYILLAGAFIIPLLFFFAIRKRKIAPEIMMLSCFQLSITFFYNFIDVSYLYLYYTPVFVSLVIAGYALLSNPVNLRADYKRV